MGQPEVAHAGRVDEPATPGQVEQLGSGGGVSAFVGDFGQCADANRCLRQQALNQRGFPHSRLSYQHQRVTPDERCQIAGAGQFMVGGQRAVAQLGISVELSYQFIARLEQVGLIEHQCGLDLHVLCRNQITVNQVGLGRGLRRKDNQHQVDIGGDRAEPPLWIGPLQDIASRDQRIYYAGLLRR